MDDIDRALYDLHASVELLPFAESMKFLHQGFCKLVGSGYLNPSLPWLNAFELAAIAKWVYLCGHERGGAATECPSVINIYKNLWRVTEAQTVYPSDPQVMAAFVLRFVYQQLPWNLTSIKMAGNLRRTRNLFGGSSDAAISLRSQFEAASGLELDDLLEASQVLYGMFALSEKVPDHSLHEQLGKHFSPTQIINILRFLTSTRRGFRQYYANKAAASVPREVVYEFNPLLRFPIMRRIEHYWCVCPEAINYAATRGVYFHISDLVGKSFNTEFGYAFEDYVGKLCLESFGPDRVTTERAERELGFRGKTNDITLIFGDTAVLIECKNSGLFSLSKKSASPTDINNDIRRNLANPQEGKGLFQLHDKIAAIKAHELPDQLMERYREVTKFLPVVLLYDEIYFANTPVTLKNLIDAVLQENGINNFEYQIWHIEEFEYLLTGLTKDKIVGAIAEKFLDPSYKDMDLTSYLSKKHGMTDLSINLFVPGGESQAWNILRKLADP